MLYHCKASWSGSRSQKVPTAVVPEKALVLATTKRMLYGEDPLYVGVGLMYKPHYVSMESFSAACMHLHVWHAAGSSEDLADKLDSSRFILVTVLEMSDVVPVVVPHPSSWTWEARRPWKELVNPWLPSGFRVSGSILCGASHLEGSLFIRSLFLISEGMPPHPCWSTSQRSFPRVCCRGLRCR